MNLAKIWLRAAVIVLVGLILGSEALPSPANPYETFWTREAQAGSAQFGADGSMTIEHHGPKDWSLNRSELIAVQPGDVFELGLTATMVSTGKAIASVTTYDAQKKPIDWTFGAKRLPAGMTNFKKAIIIPKGVAFIKPRLTGDGPIKLTVQTLAATKKTSVADQLQQVASQTTPLKIENPALSLSILPSTGQLAVTDRRTGTVWREPVVTNRLLTGLRQEKNQLILAGYDTRNGLALTETISLGASGAEFLRALNTVAEANFDEPIQWPPALDGTRSAEAIVPLNEGLRFAVTDAALKPMTLAAYSGHGLCMAFWGLAEPSGAAYTAILETPDDADLRLDRDGGQFHLAPQWQPQKGRFGYERRIRYSLAETGGYVSIAKRYRAYAQATGNLVTLAQKRKLNPDVDRLVGAANIWCWDQNAVPLVDDMQSLGMDKLLWSNQLPPAQIDALNAKSAKGTILTSRYDIYQDAMNPENFPKLKGVQADWTSEAWKNNDLAWGPDGDWIRGWEVVARDGSRIPCGVLSDSRAPAYAQARLAKELTTLHYHSRFIDTTTASPFREDYNPAHPMTRSESKYWKGQLLGTVSRQFNLITGSETGHDAAVPYVHYFEGMMSLGPFRIPEAGRNVQAMVDPVPAVITQFQLAPAYRIPLWELVYHDCVVAMWYWGDYNNKLPAVWDQRDLFNALYGTPPLLMFDKQFWAANRQRFAASYRVATPVARRTAYAEMTDHRSLTPDHLVQQSTFANGVKVWVNFGAQDWKTADGQLIGARSSVVTP